MSEASRADGLTRREFLAAGAAAAAGAGVWTPLPAVAAKAGDRPNIVLAMTDDQGWGDTGYNGHPVLKTPALDAMAAAGIRFDRFYAAAPVCSPTRGSVLTGRHPNRFGCFRWGMPIRPQELTVAQVLKAAGYVTGHFGKWHLNGKSGPGRPIPATDPLNPGRCGFDQWCSVTNYFELDPTLGRNGKPVKFTGDGSDVIVDEALTFIARATEAKTPFLAVVWYGSPHVPHRALAKDKAPYADRSKREQNYYGELTAVDRSVGRLRSELRRLGVADNTLLWFCSDNGGAFGKHSTGGLRGRKGSLWEGGVRVPGILEWPARVAKGFRTDVPCNTCDIYPTILDLLGLDPARPVEPIDGVPLTALIGGKMTERPRPMPFEVRRSDRQVTWASLIDGRYKLHKHKPRKSKEFQWRLYDLLADRTESEDLAADKSKIVDAMKERLETWQASVARSLAGKDYPTTRPAT